MMNDETPKVDPMERQRLRVDARSQEALGVVRTKTDKLLSRVLLAEWGACVVIALTASPTAWAGRETAVRHGSLAFLFGAVIVSLPVYLALVAPGHALTRYVIGVAQGLVCALFVHLCGGRMEAHFCVFGSLVLLAFYRDWRVLSFAGATMVIDHVARGLWWPESLMGVAQVELWRCLEHVVWIALAGGGLSLLCLASVRELREAASCQADAEIFAERERERAIELQLMTSEAKSSSYVNENAY